MNGIRERVVEALKEFDLDGAGHAYEFNLRLAARAVFEAMREPTEAMLKAANHLTGYSLENDYIEQEWRAMIDAALAEVAPVTSDA